MIKICSLSKGDKCSRGKGDRTEDGEALGAEVGGSTFKEGDQERLHYEGDVWAKT